MSEDFKMLDYVLFALEEKPGPNRGKEVPGSAVRIWRTLDSKVARKVGRYSGPDEDFRLGMAHSMRVRIIERTKRKPAYAIVEPWTELGSAEPYTWPVRAEDTSGGLLQKPGNNGPTRFTAAHAKYFKDIMTRHYRHGTMRDLDDETSEAIYMDDQNKLNKLIGKVIAWELRPYIKTSSGSAAGVDDFRLQLIDGVSESMEDITAMEKEAADEIQDSSTETGKEAEKPKGFPRAAIPNAKS